MHAFRSSLHRLPALVAIVGFTLPCTTGQVLAIESEAPTATCTSESRLQQAGPRSWQAVQDRSADFPTIRYFPNSSGRETLAETSLAITVTLPPPLSSGLVTSRDLDQLLATEIGLFAMLGEPREIRSIVIGGGSAAGRDGRAAILKFAESEMIYAVVDAGSGSGHYFTASLAKLGRAIEPEDRRAFENTLRALSLAPDTGCPYTSTATTTATSTAAGAAMSYPAALAAPSDPGRPSSEPEVARAKEIRDLPGCNLLRDSGYPIRCTTTPAWGSDAHLIEIADGVQPATFYADQFRDRIATGYCWATRDDASQPLYSVVRTSRAHPTETWQRYSCASRQWKTAPAPHATRDFRS